MKAILFMLLALVVVPLSGCGVFTASLDAVLEQAGAGPGAASKISAEAIDKATIPVVAYSSQPLILREDFRARLNASPRMRAAGVKIGVWVEGDPPLTLGPDPAPDPAPPAAPAESSPPDPAPTS